MLGLPRGLNPKKEHADPDEFAQRRRRREWVYTPLGFGEVLHGSKEQREEARVKDIAASLAPPVASSTPPAAAASASSVPDAPPLLASPPAAPAAPAAAASPRIPSPSSLASGSLSRFLSLLRESSPSSPAATAPPAPVSPAVPVTSLFPPSVADSHVTVHLLPHVTPPSAAAVMTGASFTPTPNPPTIVYAPRDAVHPTIRLQVRSFFDYSTLVPKSTEGEKSGLGAGLGAELRARKEKMDAERAARSSGQIDDPSKAAERKAAADKLTLETAEAERLLKSARKSGPPPQMAELTVECSCSLRGLIQRLLDYYAEFGVDLDPDSIRLVSNGREITRNELPEIGLPELDTPVPSSLAAAAQAAGDAAGGIKLRVGKSGAAGAPYISKDSLNAAVRLLQEALWHRMHPGATAALGGAAAARNATQTDRDRYFRNNTMLAECGLTPIPSALVAPSTTSDSSSSSSAASPPVFSLLLVYDELSRFTWDPATCGTDVVLTPDQLGATMQNGDNRWCTVRALKSFTSGRHSWKVRLDRCSGGNMFLGVCSATMRLNNYLGHDAHGWGFYGCGNTYRQGSSSAYGHSYRTGDTITVRLDMDARTLSFEKNDAPLGVAFTDLPEAVFPACSLYSKNDHMTIAEMSTF